MPTKGEKDALTGTELRDHEWDGITELDNPLPRWWLYVFYASIAVSILYYILYPAIPGISGYTKGLLGHQERLRLDDDLAAAAAAKRGFIERIESASLGEIADDVDLLNFSIAGGSAAYKENCAACHGAGGTGVPGYPSLADDAWLWGGTLEEIEITLRHGVRWQQDPMSRFSEMPRFGADGLLDRKQIADVAEYTLALSGRATDAASAARGAPIYAEQCAACHGEFGQGNRDLGAPNLADEVWLYGDDKPTVTAQIHTPQHGVMPAWQGRLDAATIKMLTVYVHSLGGGE